MAEETNAVLPHAALEASASGGSWPQSPKDFERLVDAHLGRLLAYAARRLRDLHEAEDVVQEVFARAYAERHRRQEVAQVTAYLYRMTANACNDVLRKRAGRAPRLRLLRAEVSQSGNETRSTHGGPGRSIETAEQAERVEALLQQLPEEQAEAVRLRVFAGLTFAEIATLTGRSQDTVGSRLRYAFAKLRNMVGKEHDQ